MNKLLRIALIVLIIGVIAMAMIPILFLTNGSSTLESGHIGDAIGGMTAPISSLVGSILVFLALKSQVMANKITQAQIHDQLLEEIRKKEIAYISDMYKHFLNSFNMFETKYYRGHKAIMRVMVMLADAEQKQAHNDKVLYYGTAAELYSILKLGKLFLEQINKSGLDADDKQYFKKLTRHHYDSFILPYLASNGNKPACPRCGEKHNGIPVKMQQVIEETLALF